MKIKILLNKDLISGILFLIISLVCINILPQQIIDTGHATISAETFPKLILWLMCLCAVGLIIKGLFVKSQEQYIQITVNRSHYKSLLILVIFACYAIAIVAVGFIISSVLVSLVMLIFYRCFTLKYALISSVIAVCISLLFKLLLGVALP